MNEASMASLVPQRRAYLVLIVLLVGMCPDFASTKASAGLKLVVASGTPVKVNAHYARSDSVLAFTVYQL